jgi:peptide/nickel transport system permease protein
MRGRDLLARGTIAMLWTFVLWCGAIAVLLAMRSLRTHRDPLQAWRSLRTSSLTAPLGPIFLPLLILIALLCLGAAWAPLYHVFGTDKVGIDVLYQALKSVRTGILIGTLTTLVTLPFAILFGIAAGYFRGVIDDVIQYLYTTLDSIPDVLLIAAMVLVMQAWMNEHAEAFESIAQRSDVRLLLLCVVLGITRWTGLCRLLRAQTLQLRELDYVQAARALGVRPTRIMWREILPNLMHLVIITVVMQFSSLVLAEAVLSYIGIGVDPGMYSWGNMINAARLELAREPAIWWSLAAAFVFLFVLVLAANVFSDAVRDAFDPRMRDGR